MIASRDSPKMDGLNAASYTIRLSGDTKKDLKTGLTDAASISTKVGGFPRGPFLLTTAKRRRQCLAMMSILPS